MKNKLRLVFTLLIAAIFMVGCSGGAEDDNTLTIGLSGDAISLDPVMSNDNQSSNVNTQIYEGLVKLDEDGSIQPSLAESYEQIDDVTYQFKLKEGVKFHNGEDLKASDVVFSLKRAIESPSVTHLYQTIDIDSVQALDDYTVEFKQSEPFAGIIAALCHPGGFIVSEKAVNDGGEDYGQNPIGTNALKFVNWSRSDSIELEQFEDYHGDPTDYSELVFRIIPEPSNRVIELESGGVDIAYDIIATDLEKIEENEELNLLKALDYGETYMGFNFSKEPMNDPLVREAITLALDVDSIVKAVFRDLGQTATGVLPPTLNYSISDEMEVPQQNIDRAKELLAEAGYEDGLSLSITTNDNKDRSDMATAMKEQLAAANIDATISVLEWSAFNDVIKNGDQDLFMIAWTADSSDPDTFLYPCFHSSSQGEGGNYIFLDDPEVDELIEKARYAQDESERAEYYAEVQQLLMDMNAWIPLHNKEMTMGTDKKIGNLFLSPLGFHSFTEVTMSAE